MRYIRFYVRYVLALALVALISWITGMKVNVWVFVFIAFLPNVAIFFALIYIGLHSLFGYEEEE